MTAQTKQHGEDLDQEYNNTWTYRGYRLDPAHFTTAMVHFYRAEVTRANTWRTGWTPRPIGPWSLRLQH